VKVSIKPAALRPAIRGVRGGKKNAKKPPFAVAGTVPGGVI
jgi:hypothetical protein